MSMKTSLSLGALAVVALLVAGIAYWKHELAACRSVGFGWRTSSCSASQCSASTARSASQCSASTARTASQCSASPPAHRPVLRRHRLHRPPPHR